MGGLWKKVSEQRLLCIYYLSVIISGEGQRVVNFEKN